MVPGAVIGSRKAEEALMTDPKWLAEARTQLGVKEGPGAKDNPTVVKYFAEAKHPEIKHDETAWCAAFVGAMLNRVGIVPSGSLMARSYEKWGVALPAPVFGCIGVKKRKGSSWLGHVGFVVAASPAYIWLLAGNQGDAVSIAKFPRKEFTAFRWPTNVPVVKSPLPTMASGQSGVKES